LASAPASAAWRNFALLLIGVMTEDDFWMAVGGARECSAEAEQRSVRVVALVYL
jgi:hypothetical protein